MDRVVDLGQAKDVTLDELKVPYGDIKLFKKKKRVVRAVVTTTATFDEFIDPNWLRVQLVHAVAERGPRGELPGDKPNLSAYQSRYVSDRCPDLPIKLVRYSEIDEQRAPTTMGFKFTPLLEGKLANEIAKEGASPEEVEEAAAIALNDITLTPNYKGINILAHSTVGGISAWLTIFASAKTAGINYKKVAEWANARMGIELRKIGFVDKKTKFPLGVYRSIDRALFFADWHFSLGHPVWPEGADA